MIPQGALTPPLPIAEGRVTVRPWQPDDAGWYVSSRDDTVFAVTRERRDLTADEWRASSATPGTTSLAIEADGVRAGSLRVVVAGGAAEISYWVAAEARGRGVATAALLLASDWAAQLPAVRRLRLVIHPDNVPSQRVALKAGYALAGKVPAPHACATEDGLVDSYSREVLS